MQKNLVKEKTFDFALEIVNLVNSLREIREFVIANQILKSGTSIGANVSEADGAISRNDFISKMSIAFKEAKETLYWLNLLSMSRIIQQKEKQIEDLKVDLNQIIKLLSKIISTSIKNK